MSRVTVPLACLGDYATPDDGWSYVEACERQINGCVGTVRGDSVVLTAPLDRATLQAESDRVYDSGRW